MIDNLHSLMLYRVFNPFAQTYQNLSLETRYRSNEQVQRRAYNQRVREIEHGCFTPLVFTTLSEMESLAKVMYKNLASMIALRHKKNTVKL